MKNIEYPIYLHSVVLGEIFIAHNYGEHQATLKQRWGWKPISLHVPLPFPKELEHLASGEKRRVNDLQEEELIRDTNWREKRTVQTATSEPPPKMHLYKVKDGSHYCAAVTSDEEEARLRADGYKLSEELWPTEPPKEEAKTKLVKK